MERVTRAAIRSLEDYEVGRAEFRRHIADVKGARRVAVGPWLALTFENRDTVRYQIQEMLRAERIFEPHRIQEEIDIYNELIPGAGELSATLFIEIAELDELRANLPKLIGVENAVRLDLGAHQIHAEAEGGRSTEAKTSTVHYMRFPVGDAAPLLRALDQPARLRVDHPNYQAATDLSPTTRRALADDLGV